MRDDAATTDAGDRIDPLLGLLRRFAEQVSVSALDELRVFPPRAIERGESRVVVASLFVDGDADRRRVFTAHYLARTDDRGRTDVQSAIEEHAVAPADRIGPVVDGVLRRLEDDLAEAQPQSFTLDGDPARWADLLDSLLPDDAENSQHAQGSEHAQDAEDAGDGTADAPGEPDGRGREGLQTPGPSAINNHCR